MRDLYRRLRVSPTADPEALTLALRSCADPELRRRVEGVLKVPVRRAAYDQLHASLSRMAALRARLGLDASHWIRAQGATDFDGHPEATLRLRTPIDPPPAVGSATSGGGPGRTWAWSAAAGLGLVALLVLGWLLLR